MYDFRDKKLAKVECVYPPSSASPIVPFVPSFKTGPNVCPLSVLICSCIAQVNLVSKRCTNII